MYPQGEIHHQRQLEANWPWLEPMCIMHPCWVIRTGSTQFFSWLEKLPLAYFHYLISQPPIHNSQLNETSSHPLLGGVSSHSEKCRKSQTETEIDKGGWGKVGTSKSNLHESISIQHFEDNEHHIGDIWEWYRVNLSFYIILSVMISAWKKIWNWMPPVSCHLSDACWERMSVSNNKHVEEDPYPCCSECRMMSMQRHSWSFH